MIIIKSCCWMPQPAPGNGSNVFGFHNKILSISAWRELVSWRCRPNQVYSKKFVLVYHWYRLTYWKKQSFGNVHNLCFLRWAKWASHNVFTYVWNKLAPRCILLLSASEHWHGLEVSRLLLVDVCSCRMFFVIASCKKLGLIAVQSSQNKEKHSGNSENDPVRDDSFDDSFYELWQRHTSNRRYRVKCKFFMNF